MSRLAFSASPRFLALSAVTLASIGLIAACGGGDGNTAPTPSLNAATGPLALVADSTAGFTLPASSLDEYTRHLQLATANAGNATNASDAPAVGSAALFDPAALRLQWCYNAEHTTTPPELQDRAIIAPVQMFDNIWAFGPRWVLQYAFKADNGKAFLIDTLNNVAEAKAITEPGLIAMGMSASLLEGAMPTHGHGDHYGGAGYLQQTYGIPIFLGSADASVGANGTPPFTVTQLDSANLQPQDKDFGGLKMTLLSTPGHTAGTFSGVVPAKLGGTEYKLAFWGGTAFPGTLALAKQYLDGSERLYRLAASKKIDGTLHTHPFVDGSLAKLDSLTKNPASFKTANPFLMGNTLAMRSLSVLRECSAAKVAQLDATAKITPWHNTQVRASATGGNTGAVLAQATLSNPFGFLQNAAVKFTALTGETCTSYTNAKGQASCSFVMVPPAGATIKAEFAEATLADGSVQLASYATPQVK